MVEKKGVKAVAYSTMSGQKQLVKSWCDLTIDGKVYWEDDVMSITYMDKRGRESDSLSVTLLPNILPPSEGSVVELVLFNDFNEVQDCGIFHVQTVTRANNKALSFTATGVEFNQKQKVKKSQNYEGTTLKDIVTMIAERLGHDVKFDAPNQVVESIYQTDETDIHFLNRIAKLHDATFSIKNDVLIFVSRSNDNLPSYRLDFSLCSSNSIVKSTRPLYKSCVLSYYDRKMGEKISVQIDEGNPTLQINCPCKNEEEAKLKGRAKLASTQRGTVKGRFTSLGQTMYAGTKLEVFNTYKQNKEDQYGESDGVYALTSVTHRYTRSSGWIIDGEFENFKLDKGK